MLASSLMLLAETMNWLVSASFLYFKIFHTQGDVGGSRSEAGDGARFSCEIAIGLREPHIISGPLKWKVRGGKQVLDRGEQSADGV